MANAIPEDEEIAVCTTCHMFNGHDIGEADPREILTAERCGECHDARAAIVWRDQLEVVGLQLASAHARIEPIRGSIDTVRLDRELAAIHQATAAIAHTYDLDGIAERSALAERRLAGTGPVIGALLEEARFRRRLGFGVLAGLLVASVGVVRLQRRGRGKSSG